MPERKTDPTTDAAEFISYNIPVIFEKASKIFPGRQKKTLFPVFFYVFLPNRAEATPDIATADDFNIFAFFSVFRFDFDRLRRYSTPHHQRRGA